MNGKKAVIVTGASGGIGKGICHLLSDKGYMIIATDTHQIKELTCDVFIQVDLEVLVNDHSEQDAFLYQYNRIKEKATLVGVVNNAAVQILDSVENVSIHDFQKTLTVNVTAPLLLTKLFLEALIEGKGSVVNIGSIHSKLTKARFVSYATSKAALLGLTQAMSVDLGGKLRVNCIQPAATRTEMLLDGFDGDVAAFELLESYHPLQRIAEVDEIAEAVLFLLSNKSGFITGSALNIDGGIGCKLHDPD